MSCFRGSLLTLDMVVTKDMELPPVLLVAAVSRMLTETIGMLISLSSGRNMLGFGMTTSYRMKLKDMLEYATMKRYLAWSSDITITVLDQAMDCDDSWLGFHQLYLYSGWDNWYTWSHYWINICISTPVSFRWDTGLCYFIQCATIYVSNCLYWW